MKKFIYFTSPNCIPCQTYGPIISSINLPIEKIDVSTNKDAIEKYRIGSVPTTILIKDGIEIWRNIGITPKITLENVFKNN